MIKLPLNYGLQLDWLKQNESQTRPVPEVLGKKLTVPVFITEYQTEEEDPQTKMKTKKISYKYYEVSMVYRGDDITNYAKILRTRWEDLRKHFYGIPEHQAEMDSKGQWTLHAMAVRAIFPKVPGELPESLVKFYEAYNTFWGIIAKTCQAYNIPYDTIPEYFDCDFMMTLAAKYGISGDALTMLITKFQFVVNDLTARKYSWGNLFPRPSVENLISLL